MGKFLKELKNQSRPKTVLMEMFSYIKIFSAAILIAFVLTRCVIVNAETPTSSMENTIMTGDRIFGFRMAYGLNFDFFGKHISYKTKDPERFDIIIFKFPDDESQLFIKRLIGLPGETVEIRDGKVYINGSDEPLDDSFVPEVPTGNYGPYKVPENSYFMLGDNREYSRDSRFWKNTFVSFDEIVGKAIVRYYPSIKLLN